MSVRLEALKAWTAAHGSDGSTVHSVEEFGGKTEWLLRVRGRAVEWMSGGRVQKSFRFDDDEEVLQAVRCSFADFNDSDRSRSWFCVLHGEGLSVFRRDGDNFYVALPFRARRVWPMLEGLLIEREVVSAEDASDAVNPTMFSLMHPLEEVKPLSLYIRPGDSEWSPSGLQFRSPNVSSSSSPKVAPPGQGEILCAPHESVVVASESRPLLVTYCAKSRRHRLWVIRQSMEQVAERLHSDLVKTFKGQFPSASGSRAAAVGDDEKLLGIESEILVERVWEEPSPSPRCDRAFFAADAGCVPLLCLLSRETRQVTAYSMSISNGDAGAAGTVHVEVSPAFKLPAVDAVPIESGRNQYLSAPMGAPGIDDTPENMPFNRDLLVLEPAKTRQGRGLLALYTGASRVAGVAMIGLDGSDSSTAVAALSHPVGGRVTVTMTNGQRVRAEMASPVSDSPMVSRCFAALDVAIPAKALHALRASFISRATARGRNATWDAFANEVFRSVGSTASEQVRGRRAMSKRKGGAAAWTELLSSDYHQKYTRAYDSASRDEARAASDGSSSSSMGVTAATSAPNEDRKVAGGTDSLRPHAHLVLLALHLLYEDDKLEASGPAKLRTALLPLLAQLAAVTGRTGFFDYYQREFGDVGCVVPVAIPGGAAMKDKVGAPPSVFSWACSLITGEKHSAAAKVLGGDPLSALPSAATRCTGYPCGFPFHRLRKMCRFYRVLYPEGGGSTGGAIAMDIVTPDAGASRGAAQGASRLRSPLAPPMPIELDGARQSGGSGGSSPFPLFSPSAMTRKKTTWQSQTRAERLVLAMVEEGFRRADLDVLPFGIALPVRQALADCREYPPNHWPVEAYRLVSREDLAALFSPSAGQLAFRASEFGAASLAEKVNERGDAGALEDGTALVRQLSSLRFGRDQRLKEVCRVLRSNRVIRIRVPRSIENSSDPDEIKNWQQTRLYMHALRALSLPVGRGMLTLGSLRPVLTEALPMPKLELKALLPPRDIPLVLDFKNQKLAEVLAPVGGGEALRQWPEFHNGVAAGLRVLLSSEVVAGGAARHMSSAHGKLVRTWVAYNRPAELDYTHAGFMMALGLGGHLEALAPSDKYWYLKQNHDPTIVGILLGMAGGKAGTMDLQVSKMLCLRIPALLPPGFSADVNFSTMTQSAALVGLGLVYRGTCHRLMTELLMNEIGNRPTNDKAADHESYSLAAGLGLGLITLGRGADAVGIADLRLRNRLRQYIDASSTSRGGGGASGGGDAKAVSIDVTSPGATAALGLMYLKTNNRAVASHLGIPDTHFAMDYVRPDFIMLRVVSRSLIMWDTVKPTRGWVQSQIPPVINNLNPMAVPAADSKSGAAGGAARLGDIDMDAIRQSYVHIIAGACLSLGFRYAGTASRSAQETISHYLRRLLALRRAKTEGGSMPELPAGGRRDGLYRLIYGSRVTVSRSVLETCVAAAASGLAMVMAGTGHLGTLRLLRSARIVVDAHVPYGVHQAIHMAIGLVFLGGGHLTLSSSDASVAVLLCAFFPRYALHPADNRYHLQAMRHLYVLAVEPRCVQCYDVDTGSPCYVPLDLELKPDKDADSTGDALRVPVQAAESYMVSPPIALPGRDRNRAVGGAGSRVSVVAPCLIPPLQDITSIQTASPRFWPVSLSLQNNQVLCDALKRKRLVLFVKRKTGHQSYRDDPRGLGPVMPTGSAQTALAKPTTAMGRSLRAFQQRFCGGGTDAAERSTQRALANFVRMGDLGVVPALVAIREALARLKAPCDAIDLWNIKLCIEFCRGRVAGALLGADFIGRVEAKVSQRFRDAALRDELRRYVGRAVGSNSSDNAADDNGVANNALFGCYLIWMDFPSPKSLVQGIRRLKVVASRRSKKRPRAAKPRSVLPLVALAWPALPVATQMLLADCITPILAGGM